MKISLGSLGIAFLSAAMLSATFSVGVLANDGTPAKIAVLRSINVEAAKGEDKREDMKNPSPDSRMKYDAMMGGSAANSCDMAAGMITKAGLDPSVMVEMESSEDPAAALAEAMGGDMAAAEVLLAALEATGSRSETCDIGGMQDIESNAMAPEGT